jgi:PadR family transcriptional regulator AphA
MTRLSPKYVLLGLLSAESAHGYQLLDYFRDAAHLGNIWHLSTSQLYALLKRMQEAGLIAGQSRDSTDAPPRIEYQITPAGRLTLADWLHTAAPSASLRRVRTEFLSRLYLAKRLALPVTPIIERQRASCAQQLAVLSERLAKTDPGVGHMSLMLVIAEMQVVMEWIDHCAAQITASTVGEDDRV